jgi:hypothetical protein
MQKYIPDASNLHNLIMIMYSWDILML